MATPVPIFPSAVATDAQLKVANNLIQTTLSIQMATADTTIWVASIAGFVANCLVSIDKEIIAVAGTITTPAPGLVVATGGRGFDGTTVAAHAVGAKVSLYIDAWHHNVLSTEVKAIEAIFRQTGWQTRLLLGGTATEADLRAAVPGANSCRIESRCPLPEICR